MLRIKPFEPVLSISSTCKNKWLCEIQFNFLQQHFRTELHPTKRQTSHSSRHVCSAVPDIFNENCHPQATFTRTQQPQHPSARVPRNCKRACYRKSVFPSTLKEIQAYSHGTPMNLEKCRYNQ